MRMAQKAFYNVLQLDQNATLDEIKLAFKRRALQVHPDKGGSKEEFQLVYQAFETLADPKARQKYDVNLAANKSAPQNIPRHQKKTSRRSNPSASKDVPPMPRQHQRCESSKRTSDDGAASHPPAPQTSQSKQTKLLMKIRHLLKQLPRDKRNDAIANQFSQKQRIILEKWMIDNADTSSETQSHSVAKALAPAAGQSTRNQPVFETSSTSNMLQNMANLPQGSSSLALCATPRRRLAKSRKKRQPKKRERSSCGAVCKEPGFSATACYRARIRFDSLEIYTGRCDLQTALEYLVVLTSIKQRMQNSMHSCTSFEERIQEALAEQGRELNLRFAVQQSAGFFLGQGHPIRTPKVCSVAQLCQLRRLLDPFRQYVKTKGRQNLFVKYSPAHLQDAWERFQSAVAHAIEITGVDSGPFVQKIRDVYESRLELREKDLQRWEQLHMGMQDQNKYREKRLREKVEICTWEQRQMAMQDKNCHRPRKFQVPLRLRIPEDIVASHLFNLRKLLVRWEHLLKRQERIEVAKQKRHRLQQQKRNREEQRKRDIAKRKRLREEERLRREALRKKMRCDLTMDEILGPRAGPTEGGKKCTGDSLCVGQFYFCMGCSIYHYLLPPGKMPWRGQGRLRRGTSRSRQFSKTCNFGHCTHLETSHFSGFLSVLRLIRELVHPDS